MAFTPTKAKLWIDTQKSQDFIQFRNGGSALNGVDVPKTRELITKSLGLPWDEIPPETVDRMTWMLPMLADYPVEILRFLRDVCQLTETMEECLDWECVSLRNELGDNQIVVIDLGSYTIKAGWGGDPAPVCAIPSVVEGQPVIQRGIIKDFVVLERIFRDIYAGLKTSPSSYTVIVAVAPKTPRSHKEEIAKILFEKLHVPNLFLCTTSYLGLCWTEKMSGLIVTCGGGICHAVPFYEGSLFLRPLPIVRSHCPSFVYPHFHTKIKDNLRSYDSTCNWKIRRGWSRH
eukprot:TRINITY_DN8594_c0_g1_i1.p1 TRINITY_DN8594_c0_g1~~TRINITY_DN8594_c0_g1_i1.p1  ORF type:complete len:288 (-),score=34.68 TRINITY_DN8594_c0_g1_i1:938-1801(-)